MNNARNDVPQKRRWDNDLVRESELFYAMKEQATEIARKMKNESIAVTQISKFTKLTIEEIEKL